MRHRAGRRRRARGGNDERPSIVAGRHQMALALLAVATAAIGFSLFGDAIQIGPWVKDPGFASGAQQGKIFGAVAASFFYVLVLLSVGSALQDGRFTARRLVFGPLQWFYMEMISLGGIFFVQIAEELAN